MEGVVRHTENIEAIWITSDPEVSSECPDYDLLYWRRWCLILGTSSVSSLLEALGMGDRFGRWLGVLLRFGEIPIEDRAVLREQLAAAKGPEGTEIMSRLALPFDRRFGESRRREGRGEHLFSIA